MHAPSQVWDAASQSYVQTPKPFGRALTVDELPLGLARFFYPPLSSPTSAELASSASSSSSSAAPGPAPAPSPSPSPAPLPLELLLPVMRTLVRRLDDLVALWSTLPLRMRGGSLLIVVEGDPTALEAALLRTQEPDPPSPDADGGEEGGEEGDEDDDAESVSTTDGEGNAAERTRQAFEMRVIDFAHTRGLLPGEEGPDEGVLLGLRTTKGLLEDLVQKLVAEQKAGRQ